MHEYEYDISIIPAIITDNEEPSLIAHYQQNNDAGSGGSQVVHHGDGVLLRFQLCQPLLAVRVDIFL